MARKAASLTISARLANGDAILANHSFPVDPINGATIATTQAAFAATLATLVADAASPTQAHVTAANNAYTTLAADIATRPGQSDVVISYNASTVVSKHTLRQAIDALMAMLPNTL